MPSSGASFADRFDQAFAELDRKAGGLNRVSLVGLRAALGFAGTTALILALVAWRRPVIRSITTLPTLKAEAITPFSSE